jgi:hypothetical protein
MRTGFLFGKGKLLYDFSVQIMDKCLHGGRGIQFEPKAYFIRKGSQVS